MVEPFMQAQQPLGTVRLAQGVILIQAQGVAKEPDHLLLKVEPLKSLIGLADGSTGRLRRPSCAGCSATGKCSVPLSPFQPGAQKAQTFRSSQRPWRKSVLFLGLALF